ncbi:MAG TPA: hypothetical protein VNV66_02550 [Pilimelia sp.]|nr:hypothetical protein [Pilimelia sp.]
MSPRDSLRCDQRQSTTGCLQDRERSRERANAQLKNWKILRKIRSSPSGATTLIRAVQTLIIAS